MEFRRLELKGLLEIRPQKIGDERGYFSEIFRIDEFARHGRPEEFVQDNQSLSIHAGTLRGIHFQAPPAAQGKLVRCLAGKLLDVAVDLRSGSSTYGRWASLVLTPEECNQVWIPVGFGHAFCTLEPNSIVSYRVTSYYSCDHDKGVAWNDPDIGIDWPDIVDPDMLSPKDRVQPRLADLPVYFESQGD